MFNPMWICFDNQEVTSTFVMPLCFHFLQKHELQLNPLFGPNMIYNTKQAITSYDVQ